MTFVARSVRYVLRKRVRTIVLLIVLTIITASMLSTIAVSRAAQQAAGRIEKEAVGGFVLASNLQGSMLTPRGGGMVRPADVRRIAQLPGVDSYMVRQNATADLVGANVAKVPGGDDYDATKEQQFGNAANVIGTNDSSKLNVFTSRTLGMAEGRHLKASDKYTSMIHEDLAKANGLKVGDTLTLKANAYDADNESHSTATVKTTIVGIFKGDSARKVSSRAELTANTIYTDLDTTRDLYQYKDGKEIYQDATFVLSKGVDVEKTMDAAKKLPVDWNNYQITRNDQYSSSMLHAARGVRSMMRGALIGVTVSAVLVLSLMLLLWMNDRRQEMGILVSLGVGKPSLVAQYLTEMVLIGLPSLALGWLCAQGMAQWLGTTALHSVNASAAKELSSMGHVGAHPGFAHGVGRRDRHAVRGARIVGGDAGVRRGGVHTDAAQIAARPVGDSMMSMNVWKRATLAIVRKPVRSGIIGLLMLMVFTSLVAQVGVSTALRTMSDSIGAGMGIGFTVSAGENPISAEEASRFSRIPGVTKTAYATKTLAQVDGARPVMPRQGPRLDSDLAMQVSVLGTTDSSLSEEFQSGLYRLEQGRHISGDGDNVLVHRDFALQNGLSVGSTFRLRQEGRNATVRVAGIFSGNVQAQSPLPSDTSENLIYSGRRVTSALTGNDQIGMIRCLSDNPQDLSAAVSQAKTMAGGKYDVTDDSARLSGVLQSVQTVRDLVRMVLLSVCLADVLVLAMALVFWIRSRIHEIGTLLALGIGKMRIVAQLAIETGLMAVVAALCSLGTGAMLSGYVSSRLLRDSGVAPLESLHVEALPPEQTLLILLLGCAVIAVALAVSCAAVLSKSPKSILSSMR